IRDVAASSPVNALSRCGNLEPSWSSIWASRWWNKKGKGLGLGPFKHGRKRRVGLHKDKGLGHGLPLNEFGP
ncbi:hypothetical protein Droror1_Dr00020050, partial [Drosera rotundifolia]